MTLTWATAHRMAMLAASHAHLDLGVTRDHHVDVFAAVQGSGICCIAEPLGNLAGAYAGAEIGGPAILLNSRLDEITMRHTAGHELGHHVFGHGSTSDRRDELERASLGGRWPDEEKLAEAFAAWFLMPPPAVRAAMRRSGFTSPSSATDVHQIACWMGTSFSGTARHLVNLSMVSQRQCEEWTRSWGRRGAKLRSRLAGRVAPVGGRVWSLRPEADRASLHVLPMDTLVIADGEVTGSLPNGLKRDEAGQLTLVGGDVVAVTEDLSESATVTVSGRAKGFTITLVPAPVRAGLQASWQTRVQHHE